MQVRPKTLQLLKIGYVLCEEIFPTDFVNLLFPNLMLFHILLFRLYFGKFVNSLLNYPQKEACKILSHFSQ